MRVLKWGLIVAFWLVVGAVLHYALPQRDIVYIQGTEIIRQDFSRWNRIFYARADSGNDTMRTDRDLRLINATRANGDVIVYRNEDTGFGWPFYFKVNSANLQAEAQGAISTRANPEWYLMRHYGWRNELLSIYPNAVSLRPIAGPEAGKPIPWLTYIILLVLAAIWYALWVRWRRFRQARLDPVVADWRDSVEAAGDDLSRRRGRLRRWWSDRRGP